MRYIFLGGFFPKDTESFLLSRCIDNFQIAANALQWKFIEGIEALIEKPISLLTLPFVGDFPRHYRDWNVPGCEFSHRHEACDLSIGYFNLMLLNHFSKYFQGKRGVTNLLSRIARNEDVCIVVYGAFPYLILPLLAIKSRYTNTRVCLIVPDLPDMMGGDNSRLFVKIFIWLNSIAFTRSLKAVDCFVFLSKFMAERLPVGNRSWCVVEGIADSSIKMTITNINDSCFTIFYSGTLAKRYGICELLESFKRIKGSHYRLWICGVGDGVIDVREAASTDKRVTYFGQLPNEDVLRLQTEATLLINPRTSLGEYTKYSFPSKIIEYFSSGTPCIMHRLPGVPDEYYDYCIVPRSEDVEGNLNAILDAERLGRDRLREIGQRAHDFIKLNKSAHRQCLKIVSMVERKMVGN